MKDRLTGLLLGLLLLLGVGCQGDLLMPPRVLTPVAQTAVSPTPPPPLIIPAPTPTPGGIPTAEPEGFEAVLPPTLRVWVNENSPAHAITLRQIAASFQEETGVLVELRLIAPDLLPRLVETAVLSPALSLPDIIIHPLDYAIHWATQGVLSPAAAAAALNTLDPATFNTNALALVQVNGRPATLPSDGAPQIILYRQDWFEARGLQPPATYQAMLRAAETLYNREAFVAGFVVPTESNLVSTHRIFEHLALANGCELIDTDGRVRLLDPACRQALDFYYTIIHNYSPIGVQTNTSTRNAYLAGRTGLVMSSPELLLQIAGLDPSNPPTCNECAATPDFLRQNSAILTSVRGSSAQAASVSFATMTALGITTAADQETAVAFAEYWFNNAYPLWLSVEPESKIPLRWGDRTDPNRYIAAWGTTPLIPSGPSLQDLYGRETVNALQEALINAQRWGFSQNQGDLVGQLYKSLTFSVVLQEMLSGYFNTEKTLAEAYRRVVDLIPGYLSTEEPSNQ